MAEEATALQYTPSSSWLNLVEGWFRGTAEERIRRGSGSLHSVAELEQAIDEYRNHNNRQPKLRWMRSS